MKSCVRTVVLDLHNIRIMARNIRIIANNSLSLQAFVRRTSQEMEDMKHGFP